MPIEAVHDRVPEVQQTEPKVITVIRFKLPSALARDGLAEYFENLRINTIINDDPEELGAVRVSLPLPVASIVETIPLKALGGTIILLESQSPGE